MKKKENNRKEIKLIALCAALLIVWSFLCPADTEANLSGVVDYSYNYFRTMGASSAKTSNFSQSYSINKNGLLFNKSLGNFSAGFGYTNSNSRSDSAGITKNDSDSYNVSVSSSMFPGTFSPLTFQYSRVTTARDNNLNPEVRGRAAIAKTISSTYRTTWRLISKRKLPTLTSNFSLSSTESDNQSDFREEDKRTAKFDLNKGGTRTNYRLNYNYELFASKRGGITQEVEAHALSGSINRKINRKTTVNASTSFNPSRGRKNLNSNMNLTMRHSRKLDSNYSYNFAYNKDADKITTMSHRFGTNVRYTPTSKLSSNAGYSFANSDANSSNAHSLNLGGSYRITERWNSSASTNLNYSTIGESSSMGNSQSIGTSYSKPFNYVRLNSSYSFNISRRSSDSITDTESKDTSGTNMSNSIGFGIASRTLKVANISSNFRLSKTNSRSKSKTSKKDGSAFVTGDTPISRCVGETTCNEVESFGTEGFSSSLGVNSNYIKKLSINSSLGYNNTLAKNGRNENLNTGVSLSYTLFKNLVLSANYNFSIILSPSAGDKNKTHSYSTSTSYSKRITRRLNFNIAARHNTNWSTGGTKSSIYSVSPRLNYNIGRLTFALDFKWYQSRISGGGAPITDNSYYSFFVRVSRRF